MRFLEMYILFKKDIIVMIENNIKINKCFTQVILK